METLQDNSKSARIQRQVDWADVQFALVLGAAAVTVKLAGHFLPALHFSRTTTDIVASTLTIGYIVARARRRPEKLDTWGLISPFSPSALLTGAALLAVAVGALAAVGIGLAGSLSLEPALLSQMLEYIPAAFPQQFVLCSVGLTALATLRALRGSWRLPLAVGLCFSIAHFWTPARIPGTIVPIQMLITFPAGFVAAFYFLKYRNILTLTGIHAVIYPLLHNWIEAHI